MKTLTDDPDWAPKLYEARALAIRFVSKHGRRPNDAATFRVAERNGLKVTYHPQRSPRLLTIDTSGYSAGRFERVLEIEWNDGDAWRLAGSASAERCSLRQGERPCARAARTRWRTGLPNCTLRAV